MSSQPASQMTLGQLSQSPPVWRNTAGTHYSISISPESCEHLCAKCDRYAEHWTPVAEKLAGTNKRKSSEKTA